MKQRMLIILPALIVALNVLACLGLGVVRGSGRVVEEERQVSDFTGRE